MTFRRFLLSCFLACTCSVACGGTTSDREVSRLLPANAVPRSIRSPCDGGAGRLALATGLHLACIEGPSSPVAGDPLFWRGEAPCSARWVMTDASGSSFEQEEIFDYAVPYAMEGASYGAGGSIAEWAVPEALAGSEPALLRYGYASGWITTVEVERAGVIAFAVEYEYDLDHLVRETRTDDGRSLVYDYDPNGQLLGTRVLVDGAELEGFGVSYTYRADGRLDEQTFATGSPSAPSRWRLEYDTLGRLVGATYEPGANTSRGPTQITYRYDGC